MAEAVPVVIFKSSQDREIIAAAGFFCNGCLVGRPSSESSPDARYCRQCYDFLGKEAELLPPCKGPAWVPKEGGKPRRQKHDKGNTTQYSRCEVFAHAAITADNDFGKKLPNKNGRPLLNLPVDKILRLAGGGTGVPEILKVLDSDGVRVSRRTIYSILSGQRALV